MTVYWRFTVDCPRCAGTLTPITGSRPHPRANLESKAVAQCDHCRDTFILTLTLSSERDSRRLEGDLYQPNRPIPHGTTAGYAAHFRSAEPPCAPCKHAHALQRQVRRMTPCEPPSHPGTVAI